jgi:hypothetical protein
MKQQRLSAMKSSVTAVTILPFLIRCWCEMTKGKSIGVLGLACDELNEVQRLRP